MVFVGQSYSTRDAIVQPVLDFYGRLFGTTHEVEPVDMAVLDSGTKVSTEMNQLLLKPISAEEVKVAVFL